MTGNTYKIQQKAVAASLIQLPIADHPARPLQQAASLRQPACNMSTEVARVEVHQNLVSMQASRQTCLMVVKSFRDLVIFRTSMERCPERMKAWF